MTTESQHLNEPLLDNRIIAPVGCQACTSKFSADRLAPGEHKATMGFHKPGRPNCREKLARQRSACHPLVAVTSLRSVRAGKANQHHQVLAGRFCLGKDHDKKRARRNLVALGIRAYDIGRQPGLIAAPDPMLVNLRWRGVAGVIPGQKTFPDVRRSPSISCSVHVTR